MRRGQSPTVKRGQFIGQEMSVNHVILRAEVPELDNVLANLELMPQRMNSAKGAKLDPRQIEFARRFVAAGLISADRVPWAAPFGEKTKQQPVVATAANQSPIKTAPVSISTPFAGSSRSPVFHKSSCSSVSKLSPKNLVTYASCEEAIQAGKRPCAECMA